MRRRISYIILAILITHFVSLQVNGQQPSVYEISRMSFSSGIFSDISPVIVDDGIIFCSNRRFSTLKDRTAFDGRRLYNIYLAERKDTSDWLKPVELKSERSSLFNNGPLCIAPDGKTVYFTSEIETGKIAKKKNFKNHNGIFIAEISGTDLTGLQPFKYNNPAYEVAQPAISSDGKYLFFASDMPGGQGGSDLYYCELINSEWSSPINLGPKVNSSGSECFPYMHPSGRLYFTSDRPGGLGQLDVYYTSLSYGSWEDPTVLPEPINSAYDDFAFVAEEDLQTGFFSSNRSRTDDIYEFSSNIRRIASCGVLEENSYCYQFTELNAVKYDSMPFRYIWNFGDGNKDIGAVVIHCYDKPGTYVSRLDVENLVTNEIKYDVKTDTIHAEEIVQPYITSPDTVQIGRQIRLSGAQTNLPGWNISQFYWNFGDETIMIGKEVDKTFIKPGTYNVQLIVSDEPQPGSMAREACISKNIVVLRQP